MNWEFDLVGILDADDPAVRGNTDMVLINVAYFDEARQIGRGKTGWYIVRVADSAQARADLGLDRRPVHELARRDQDPAREGVRARLRQADRRHRRPGHAHPDRGVLHDPDPHRQHHGPVHPRAHSGAGDPEDARLLGRQGHRARARGGGAAAGPGRRHRHGRGGRPPCPRSTAPPAAASRRSSSGSTPGSSPPRSRPCVALCIGLPPALRASRLQDRRRAGRPLARCARWLRSRRSRS